MATKKLNTKVGGDQHVAFRKQESMGKWDQKDDEIIMNIRRGRNKPLFGEHGSCMRSIKDEQMKFSRPPSSLIVSVGNSPPPTLTSSEESDKSSIKDQNDDESKEYKTKPLIKDETYKSLSSSSSSSSSYDRKGNSKKKFLEYCESKFDSQYIRGVQKFSSQSSPHSENINKFENNFRKEHILITNSSALGIIKPPSLCSKFSKLGISYETSEPRQLIIHGFKQNTEKQSKIQNLLDANSELKQKYQQEVIAIKKFHSDKSIKDNITVKIQKSSERKAIIEGNGGINKKCTPTNDNITIQESLRGTTTKKNEVIQKPSTPTIEAAKERGFDHFLLLYII